MTMAFHKLRTSHFTLRTSKVCIVRHPLLAEHLTYLRDKKTPVPQFRWHLKQAAGILLCEVLASMPTKKIRVSTPMGKTQSAVLAKPIVLVAILRSGLEMTEAMTEMLPKAAIGHIGLYRDEETLKPVYYYSKIPKITSKTWVLLVDPMLATGGSAVYAANLLKRKGAKTIKVISVIAARQGIRVMQRAHPDVEIHVAAIDPALNNKGFIVPGLGDCGDRLLGTL